MTTSATTASLSPNEMTVLDKPSRPLMNRDTHRWMLVPTRQSVLRRYTVTPIIFNPESKTHRAAFAHFMVHGKWPEGIRFIEEWPHTSAVTTIQTKLTQYAIRREVTAVLEAKDVMDRLNPELLPCVVLFSELIEDDVQMTVDVVEIPSATSLWSQIKEMFSSWKLVQPE